MNLMNEKIGDLELRRPSKLGGFEIWSISGKRVLCFFNNKGTNAVYEWIKQNCLEE